MATFLEDILDQYPQWEENTSGYVFILPSKRAGFFLKHHMARRVKRTLLAPQIWSIEDFVEEISGLKYTTEVQLLFKLYKVYLDSAIPEKESFESFSKWGGLLIQDFNEIDRYLINSEELFNTLANLQEIRNWSPDGSSTPLIEKRLNFWKSLAPLYQEFVSTLLQDKVGYQGMVYRKAAENAQNYALGASKKKHVFIGFNALNEAEISILRTFLNTGHAEVIWDGDPAFIENSYHEAGLYMRRHLKQWPELKGVLKGLGNHLSNKKEIRMIGIPKAVTQAKYCGLLLNQLLDEEKNTLSGTAVVLGNELLLNPIRNSLPKGISAANITMGYAIKDSPAVQLFEMLLGVARQKKEKGWYIRLVLEVLGHPFLKQLFKNQNFYPEKARNLLIQRNALYVDEGEFNAIGFPIALREIIFPNQSFSPDNQLGNFRELIGHLRGIMIEENDRISLEVLFRLDQLFLQISQLCREYPFVSTLRTLETLFKELLADEKLDFEGEPLEGLQIMGMLESRNLDFETIILTSVNEGILPSGKSNNSFIPFDVKREFGLPTYKEKDAVYAYHFYRLIQRAKKVYLLYNTEPDTLEGGEPSRFLSQLRTDKVLGKFVTDVIAAPPLYAEAKPLKEISKNENLLASLRKFAESGFSPTSLSKYVENPISFYKRYVLNIKESDVLEETIAPNTFGEVLHVVLQNIYDPWTQSELKQNLLESALKEVPKLVEKHFDEIYLKGAAASGRNLIAQQVLIQHVRLLLKQDIDAIQKQRIRILGIEKKFVFPLEVPGLDFKINIKGTVDRIEEVDGRIQIIDYKSGLVQPHHIRVKAWPDIQDPDKSKALQLLCYAWLYAQSQPDAELRAGIVSFKNLSSGKIWFGEEIQTRKYEEIIGKTQLEHFQTELKSLIQDIFNPSIPFSYPEFE